MKLGIYSNAPWTPMGYGVQCALLAPRLRDAGHEVVMFATYGIDGGTTRWQGMPVVGMANRDPMGQAALRQHVEAYELDVVLYIGDIWPLLPWHRGEIHKDEQGNAVFVPHFPFVPWFPVDTEPWSPKMAEIARTMLYPLVYSQHGAAEGERAGVPLRYVPCAYDPAVYSPGDRREARQRVGLPADRYIVGMVAANKGYPSRKAFPEQIEAFARFHVKHPDALLYLHTVAGAEHDGIDLVLLCRTLGLELGRDVLFTEPYLMTAGVPPAMMADLYRSFDVLLSVSMAEGFGIPLVEAQACGTPVIVGDWTSMPELCFGGWKVARDEAARYWCPYGAWWYLPRPAAIADRLRQAYRHSGDERIRQRAIEGAAPYAIDAVMREHWTPVMAEICARVSAERRAA